MSGTHVLGAGWRPRMGWRRVFAVAVLVSSGAEAAGKNLVAVATGEFPARAGDWLTNYGGGFVRRGLFGQMLLTTGLKGSALTWALFLVQVTCYAVIVAYVVAFLRRTRYAWWAVALALGPVCLPFIGRYTDGSLRKEILIFLALAMLGWARMRMGEVALSRALTWGAIAVYAVAVFSWEGSALVLPAVLWMLLANRSDGGEVAVRRAAAVAASLIAAVGFGLSCAFIGDAATLDGIRGALVSAGIDWSVASRSTLIWIGVPVRQALADVGASYPMYLNYLPLFVLSILPLVLTGWFRRNWKWAAALLVTTLPLYVVATDYGRFIHILVFALVLCAMTAPPTELLTRWWSPLAAVLYVSVWGVPHFVGAGSASWPWVGVLASLGRNVIWVAGLAARMLR